VTPTPRRLRYTDIYTGLKSGEAAFKDDPMVAYLMKTKDAKNKKPLFGGALTRLLTIIHWIWLVRGSDAWTIDAGKACVTFYDPTTGNNDEELIFDFLASPIFEIDLSKEQKKRREELVQKAKEAIESSLGSRKPEMLYVSRLFADPATQGRGYGYALANVAVRRAEHLSRAAYLVSSNAKNTGFYNSVGFFTVGEIVLGDSNPEWEEPPVVMSVMVRELAAQ